MGGELCIEDQDKKDKGEVNVDIKVKDKNSSLPTLGYG